MPKHKSVVDMVGDVRPAGERLVASMPVARHYCLKNGEIASGKSNWVSRTLGVASQLLFVKICRGGAFATSDGSRFSPGFAPAQAHR